jgi:hypothetical protein
MLRLLVLLSAVVTLAAPSVASAQKDTAGPKPDTYLCPNAAGTRAVDCFLNAVEHLYTMCRQVKSIEIIEFGYEKSEEGVNGAKSEYCVDKHKLSMTRPYQAALREATGSRSAVDGLRELHEQWQKALIALKWKPGESDQQYKERIAKPYEVFREQGTAVRVALETGAPKANLAAVPTEPKSRTSGVAKAKPATTPGTSKSPN